MVGGCFCLPAGRFGGRSDRGPKIFFKIESDEHETCLIFSRTQIWVVMCGIMGAMEKPAAVFSFLVASYRESRIMERSFFLGHLVHGRLDVMKCVMITSYGVLQDIPLA